MPKKKIKTKIVFFTHDEENKQRMTQLDDVADLYIYGVFNSFKKAKKHQKECVSLHLKIAKLTYTLATDYQE